MEITIKMKTIVRKPLNDKNPQASFQKFRQQTPEEGRKHIGRIAVEITIKMKTIVRKPLNDNNHQASSQKFRQLMIFSGVVFKLLAS